MDRWDYNLFNKRVIKNLSINIHDLSTLIFLWNSKKHFYIKNKGKIRVYLTSNKDSNIFIFYYFFIACFVNIFFMKIIWFFIYFTKDMTKKKFN